MKHLSILRLRYKLYTIIFNFLIKKPKIIHQADFIIPIKIDSIYHNVYVIKRPGVDCFMKRMGELFEIVVFTASLAKV